VALEFDQGELEDVLGADVNTWSAGFLLDTPHGLAALAVWVTLLLAGRRSGWFALGIAGAILLFFRDPERPLIPDADVIYATADGLIVDVDRVVEPLLAKGEAFRVSTFLSLHNVHVNRSPVEGDVEAVKKVAGGFYPALFSGARSNHQNRIDIDSDLGRVTVVQISGTIARRISCWVRIGDSVTAGQRIGLIHFGSRTEVLFPVESPGGSAKLLVRVGDRVRAGITPVARYCEGVEKG
jgi:phosphatidylserine decarboxylase